MEEDELNNEFTIKPEEQEHFIVEDKDDVEKACALCSKLKVDKHGVMYVCGTYKARNDYAKSKGQPDIQSEFSCSEFEVIG